MLNLAALLLQRARIIGTRFFHRFGMCALLLFPLMYELTVQPTTSATAQHIRFVLFLYRLWSSRPSFTRPLHYTPLPNPSLSQSSIPLLPQVPYRGFMPNMT
jgi:hypothetical protein